MVAMAERFMATLQQIEQSGDVEPLVSLFGEQAEIANLSHAQPLHGRDGVRRFWQEYLRAFREIRSEFTHAVEREDLVVLEWISRGRLPTGRPISYRGVSILQLADDRVQRFRTYYDSAVIALEYVR